MKILIRLPNWLGDVVMSTAFVSAVRQLYHFADIDIIIKKELASIAALIPGVNTVHAFSKQDYKGFAGAYRFGKQLRAQQYNVYFNLPASLSSVAMAFATRAKKRVGYAAEGGLFMLTHTARRPAHTHRVMEYMALLSKFSGKPANPAQVLLQAAPLPVNKQQLLINFNSEAASRRMPVQKALSLLKALLHAYPTLTFGLIGAPKEKAYADELLQQLPDATRIVNYAGATTLPQLAHLMAGSAALLTVDSGPAHLANAVNLPVVVLFGAGNENNTAPWNKEHLAVLRYGQLACEPCVRNTCKLYGVPKCMQMLDEQLIINQLNNYIPHA